jgi:hypothetical protein
MSRYCANEALEDDMPSYVARQRVMFDDGSALHRSIYGDQVLVYPPRKGSKFSVELDDVGGDGKYAQELVSVESEKAGKKYIDELVFHIKGPGEYSFFIRNTATNKIVYEYISSTEYDPEQHDNTFRVEEEED